MNAQLKRRAARGQIGDIKEKKRRIVTPTLLACILIVAAVSAYFTYSYIVQPSSAPVAAIVDQLSLTYPNQTFIERATSILKQAGYSVDYYPGKNVTVEFYRNLAMHGYSLIILRVHSGLVPGTRYVGFFTSERYDQSKYVQEQLWNQLWKAVYSNEDVAKGITYFGISPYFVTGSMNGKFENTVIIMMGCNGLTYTPMAEAFIEKGAKAYIGWNGSVSASYTDEATANLLQHLILERQTIGQAVENTDKQVGADPVYNSLLTYYPPKVGEQTITQNFSSSNNAMYARCTHR
jgi:hypothetical protein